ncbi:unnamed protein product [Sphagnum jensenii]|uniref:Uncharacterized protein n=1 Tax=Sphagnum jensenii TaxID=128206 RepID=A0ABP1B3G5_9BRYO
MLYLLVSSGREAEGERLNTQNPVEVRAPRGSGSQRRGPIKLARRPQSRIPLQFSPKGPEKEGHPPIPKKKRSEDGLFKGGKNTHTNSPPRERKRTC